MTAVVASLAGTTLGRYRLVEKLGQGGMATVYRAEDPTLGRQVAVKVMHPFIAERSEALSRFEREAKAVAGLRHPNVLALHDYAPATAGEPAYLVMELLSGPSLQRFLVEHGAPLAEVAAILGLRIAQALAAAHARGIVHRDVKPENVMFDGHRVVLCDFGIARIAAADGVTATGAVLGSPAYMSPEQASGHEVDARSDLFSLGALLYQLATGAVPFSGSSPLVTMAKIVKGEHAPPSAKNPRVPPYLERVIERCLQHEPAARFASADAVAEALRHGLGDDGFGDADAELAAYLGDPAAYNAAAEARIVDGAWAQAERAQARGETARALAAANRVLAWRPDDARALALVAGLAARPRRRALVVGAALLATVAAAGVTWRMHARRGDGAASAVTGAPAAVRRPPFAVRLPPSADERAGVAQKPVAEKAVAEKAAAEKADGQKAGAAKAAEGAGADKGAHARKHKRVVAAAAAPAIAATTAAGAPAAPTPPPTTGKTTAPAVAPDAPATLAVAIAPWCDLSVDGQPRGRTPQTLSLPPGAHHLVCVNPASGNRLTRDLALAPGEKRQLRERLYPMVRLQPQLRRGDAYAIDGAAPTSAPASVEPGRRRVTLYQGGAELDTRYLDVPPAGCTLVDTPRLACEKP